jgi:hypothetical protein
MTEHIMTRDAGAISIRAYEHATRLGHPYLGGEHYLDRDALTTVGIDVDAVRAATEASFGRATLARAARDVHRGRAGSARAAAPARRGTGSSCRTAPASSRPYWVPAARPRPGTPPRRMSSTSHWASSPPAKDWCPQSCRGSAHPGQH